MQVRRGTLSDVCSQTHTCARRCTHYTITTPYPASRGHAEAIPGVLPVPVSATSFLCNAHRQVPVTYPSLSCHPSPPHTYPTTSYHTYCGESYICGQSFRGELIYEYEYQDQTHTFPQFNTKRHYGMVAVSYNETKEKISYISVCI